MYVDADNPYYDSAVGEIITKQRAFLELEEHGIEDYEEFLNDVGDKLRQSQYGLIHTAQKRKEQ